MANILLEQAESRDLLILLLVLAVLLVLVALPIVGYRKRKSRLEQLEVCAHRLGFRFDGKGTSFNLGEWADLSLFEPNPEEKVFGKSLRFLSRYSQGARNVMSGPRNDLEITVLDYERNGWECTAVCLRSPGLDLPAFLLEDRKEGEGEEEDRIPFTGDPRFSQLYSVYGRKEDQPRVRSTFTAATLDFFSAHEGLVVEALEDRLAVCRQRGGFVKPDAVPAFVEQSVTITELFRAGRARANAPR